MSSLQIKGKTAESPEHIAQGFLASIVLLGSVILQVPKGLKGRFGHGALLSTGTSIVFLGPIPGVFARTNPRRRKTSLVVSSIVAPKRLLA